jgi:hypothetical protein
LPARVATRRRIALAVAGRVGVAGRNRPAEVGGGRRTAAGDREDVPPPLSGQASCFSGRLPLGESLP